MRARAQQGGASAGGRGDLRHSLLLRASPSLMPELMTPTKAPHNEAAFSFQTHGTARNNMNNIILAPWEKISKSNIESGL